jgi:D-serine deaminase-like pyridoxal phosphate-dependent protein
MAAGGADDILITTEVVGTDKVRRLVGLARRATIATVVDDAEAARAIGEAASTAGLEITCLVDLDIGQRRTGVAPEGAVELGRVVVDTPGLRLAGIQAYDGHNQGIRELEARRNAADAALDIAASVVERFDAAGLRHDVVSAAGTGTFPFAVRRDFVTEVQPGSFIAMDATYGKVEGVDFEQALSVLSTVISRRDGWVVIDAGMKSLSTEYGEPEPLGVSAEYTSEGDEHGKLTFGGTSALAIGDVLRIVPTHCDTTINLHDTYVLTRGQDVIGTLPVAARGQVQ